jgi:DNA-binding response OmpR family regulator
MSVRAMAKTILIVDDSEAIRLTLEAIFEDRGFDVVAAESIAQAQRQLARRFDAALVDVHLPDGSGLTFVRELRARCPSSVAVVLSGEPGVDPTCADLVAVKGGDPDELATIVEQLIARAAPPS